MSNQARREYILTQRRRYQNARYRAQKTMILDELVAICGYNRSYATRLMNQTGTRARRRKPGPQRRYTDVLLPHIR